MSAEPVDERWKRVHGGWIRLAVGILLSVFVFYPSLVGDTVPVRVVALALGIVALGSELWITGGPPRKRIMLIASAALGVASLVAAIEWIARALGDRMLAVNAEHIFVLFPVYALFAAISFRRGGARLHAGAFLAVASLTAAFALIESIFTVSLLGRGEQFLTSQREGATRALVGAEHVLVLGALLAVAVALAAMIRNWRLRLPVTVLLVAGCWATGSRAAAALCLIVAVIQAIPALVRWMQRFWYLLAAAVGIAFTALALLASFTWTSFIDGDTGVEYSANYRFASYAVLARVFIDRPFGYFLGTVPGGTWMMGSELRGPVDLARSADSEIVFAVFAAGWLGALVYLATFAIGILALRTSPTLGFTTLLLTSLGFIMSLHGWDAASMVWYALLGACLATMFDRRPDSLASSALTKNRTPVV